MLKKAISLLVFVVLYQTGFSQGLSPNGRFLQRETKVGENLEYSLSLKYDRNLTIVFPDSLYAFGNFEYNKRRYVPTVSDSVYSYDSVIYSLSTFEIDSVQFLQLPVFVVKGQDSLAVFSNIDSVFLVPTVVEIPENPEMRSNTDLVKIKRQINYPYILVGMGIVFLVVFVIMLFFGKQISRWWRVFMLRRAHKKFIERFFNLMRDVSGNNPSNTAEHVLAVWKNYMEKLEKQPVSKLTTKEILVLHANEQLREHLKRIDRSIYGGERGNDLFASFDYLMRFSVDIYNDKIKEIKNG